MPKTVATAKDAVVSSRALSTLLLDPDNARFGSMVGRLTDQTAILDHIVETFGIDDVLSSLAVNGYFQAEPLVCRKAGNDAVVVEGNRRTAACLILANDPRAANQQQKAKSFQKIWNDSGEPQIDPVPVILYEEEEGSHKLLSYLGVRHIAASQPWDSFAKARWVSQVVEANNIPLRQVAEMIGDQHRTIHRMLLGYYFATQAIEIGAFNPDNSLRKGRGSVTQYPFSWVYSFLGYSTPRSYLGILDDAADPKKNPVPEDKRQNIELIFRALFGDSSKGKNAAIEDSRSLGALAAIFNDPKKISLLEQGKSLDEIIKVTQPIDVRLTQALLQVRDILRELVSSLTELEITKDVANSTLPLALGIQKLANALVERLTESRS